MTTPRPRLNHARLIITRPDNTPLLSANRQNRTPPPAWSRLVKRWRTKAAKDWRAAYGRQRLNTPVEIMAYQLLPPFYPGVALDGDNIYPTVKAVTDGLVDAGALPDDTDEYIHARVFLAASATKDKHGGLYIAAHPA